MHGLKQFLNFTVMYCTLYTTLTLPHLLFLPGASNSVDKHQKKHQKKAIRIITQSNSIYQN